MVIRFLRPSRYAWLVVALLWLVALLNYLDRLMIATMRDPIKADISMSDADFGLLMSVFLWVYAVVSPLGGFLGDRVGRRRVILGSLVFWSAATWLSGHASTFHQLFLARALMGISEACYVPAGLALIADYHRGPTRSLATGLHMSGIYVGAALGGMGGFLAEQWGWRYGFTLFGAFGMGYALILMFLLEDAPVENVQPLALRVPRLAKTPGKGLLAALFGQPGFWVLLALNVLVGVVNWMIYGWLPTYLKEHFSLGLGAAGMSATGYIQAASFVGVLTGGVWADRWSRVNRRGRALVPAIGYCVAGPCLLMAASTDLLPLAIVGLAVFGLGRGFFDANQMPILRDLVDERYSATGYGLLNCIGTAAGGIMVYIGGAMRDAQIDLGRVFQGCAGALLVVAFLLFMVRPSPAARTKSETRDVKLETDANV
jgi:MFS transporter, Spinster family, sphingosine-1-phosphate transporter